MEAKDLMIGDWVYNHRNWECPIVEIHKDSAVVIARHYGEEEFLLSDLRPIPLTPEILEKNGFVRNETWAEWVHYCDNIFIDFTILENETSFHLDLPNAMIDYVHELQHALRLCGIDKEIEL